VPDFVWVVHESLEDAAPTRVSQESFDRVWALRGFVECDEPVDDPVTDKPQDDKPPTKSAAPSGDKKEK
jgi:hypothetical protein